MNDPIKTAEQRGYSKGYQAGRRKKKREISYAQHMREKQAFLDRAFLAALPVALAAQNWKCGDKPITSINDRTSLARDFAIEALKQRPSA